MEDGAINLKSSDDHMEFPKISFPSLTGILDSIRNGFSYIWNSLVQFSGGNPVLAVVIVGFAIYLIVDLSYHTFLDKPLASGGAKMMHMTKNFIIFLFILVLMLLYLRKI